MGAFGPSTERSPTAGTRRRWVGGRGLGVGVMGERVARNIAEEERTMQGVILQ